MTHQPIAGFKTEAEIEPRSHEIEALLRETGFQDIQTTYASLKRGMVAFVRGKT